MIALQNQINKPGQAVISLPWTYRRISSTTFQLIKYSKDLGHTNASMVFKDLETLGSSLAAIYSKTSGFKVALLCWLVQRPWDSSSR